MTSSRRGGLSRNPLRNETDFRGTAVAVLRRLAAGIQEPTEHAAVARLLERVAQAEPEVASVLMEAGALAVLREELWLQPVPLLEAIGMGRTLEGARR